MEGRKEKSKILNFFKSHKKVLISLVVVITFLSFFLTINYGRYVKDIIEVYYLRTKNFYFNSDKLTIHGKEYEISPWDGSESNPLMISIQMNSLLNSLKGTTSNIDYIVSCETDGKVSCSIDSENGSLTQMNRTIKTAEVISTSSHKDSFIVYLKPNSSYELKDGDRVNVTIKAKSTYPYEEELSAKFTVIIGDYGVNYVIEDTLGEIYLDDIITNTLSDNRVKVTLTIKDINKITIDMSSKIFSLDGTTYELDENKFIKKVTFYVEPKSSMLVRFYKKDANVNYSHNSYDGESSIIDFEAEEIK